MYEELANESRGAQRNGFALQAAETYLAARRPDDAARALDLLSPPLSTDETFDRSLIGGSAGAAAWSGGARMGS